MKKMFFKRLLSMVLVATLLIQILPATAKGAEITTTEPENLTMEAQTGLSDMAKKSGQKIQYMALVLQVQSFTYRQT